MKKEPVKVSLIGKRNDNTYQIQFPNLPIPVNVNEDLYQRMLGSSQYCFIQHQVGSSQKGKAHNSSQKMLSV